ncbi:MAG: quinolinate synthase [Deltaproteobacteria bacterium]|nr:MAG: quinolinate synthase [Deltaproteobacteria bacterium]
MSRSTELQLAEEILELKKKRGAVILAHYYQIPPIQDVADHVGDSLALAMKATELDADVIVVAGVQFMAETAKVLNPRKRVLIPYAGAGCTLADDCPADEFEAFVRQHPGHAVVTYVNSSLGVKALSDVTCTSANAVKVVSTFDEKTPIVFAPDRNLGAYVAMKSGRDIVTWNAVCEVHNAYSLERVSELLEEHPGAKLAAHPECPMDVLKIADFVGSTSGILNYVVESKDKEFVVATEPGVLYQIGKRAPGKRLFPVLTGEPPRGECRFMKLATLEHVRNCLRDMAPEVQVDEDLARRAAAPIRRMMEIGR